MRRTTVVVPASRSDFAPDQLQFITSSAYDRTELFGSPRLRGEFAEDKKRRASLRASRDPPLSD
jgi:hypothetical protein